MEGKERRNARELMRKRRVKNANATLTENANRALTDANKDLQRRVIELEGEVARLKQLLAQRPKVSGPEIVVPRRVFVSPFSRAAQASMKAMPNNSPMGRMNEL